MTQDRIKEVSPWTLRTRRPLIWQSQEAPTTTAPVAWKVERLPTPRQRETVSDSKKGIHLPLAA